VLVAPETGTTAALVRTSAECACRLLSSTSMTPIAASPPEVELYPVIATSQIQVRDGRIRLAVAAPRDPFLRRFR
jgi:hypothetical protein